MSEMSDSWFNFAREDMRVAEWTMSEGIHNQTCFHSQQCVEKVIKGMLVARGIVPPKIHTLSWRLKPTS